ITDQGKGIGRIEWRVNGVTAAVTADAPGTGSTRTVTQTLALDAGDNRIEVIAYNGPNLLASVPAQVGIRFAGTADNTEPRLYVLAIGINAYAQVDSASDSELLRFPKLA